jgi:hypothetical protein
VAVRLTLVLDDVIDAVKDPRVLDAAADALEETMTEGVSSTPIGHDLRLSGFRGGPMEFKASYTAGTGVVTMPLAGGTYALADKGRYKAPKRRPIRSKTRKRRGQRRPTLSTPWGPRVSVRRSKWPGFRLTDRFGNKAIGQSVEAAAREVVRQFDSAL